MPEQNSASNVDALIVGAGAAGMMCAIEAARRGRSVLLLDHAKSLAEKIRISGGGRCNFTNLNAKPENYQSHNPHFCRSALARYTPQHFIALLQKHNIGYHEKTLGQLFCDDGSDAIIGMLKSECEVAGVKLLLTCDITEIKHFLLPTKTHPLPSPPLEREGAIVPSPSGGRLGWGWGAGEESGERARFHVSTSRGEFDAVSLVIATGGLSIPKIGATPFGYHVAEQFGVPMNKLKPGLVPLSFAPNDWKHYACLAGVSVDALVSYGKQSFRENLLFTHRGLSGPSILQISSYWETGQPLRINLLPDDDMAEIFVQQRGSRILLTNFLAQYLPKRFADVWCVQFAENKPLNQHADRELAMLATRLHDWQITPSGTLGYAKAEVTCGGVDTRALSSKTMECNAVPGLFFIGEVVDVTGQLGGYNLQWAWSSGYAAGQSV